MKKKNGAHSSAMSELLSKTGEAKKDKTIGAKPPILNRGNMSQKPPVPNAVNGKSVKKPSVAPVVQRPQPQRRPEAPMQTRPMPGPASEAAQKASSIPAPAPQKKKKKKTSFTWGKKVMAVACFLILVCIAAVVAIAVTMSGADKISADILLDPGVQAISASRALQEESTEDGRHNVKFIFYQKPEVACTTGDTTVGELCTELGITLDEGELLNTNMEQAINSDVVINVDNVSHQTVAAKESVPFETRYVDVQTVPRGKTKVHQEGKNGVRTVEYDVTYVNGQEMSRERKWEYVSTKPTECIIYRGTGGTVTIDGKTYSYSYYLDCQSTVYTGGGTTATGLPATEAVIAVDPKVIPLRSQVYIEGVGIRIAADTGGAIKGNIVDIYFNETNPRLQGYGRRTVRVYIFG